MPAASVDWGPAAASTYRMGPSSLKATSSSRIKRSGARAEMEALASTENRAVPVNPVPKGREGRWELRAATPVPAALARVAGFMSRQDM